MRGSSILGTLGKSCKSSSSAGGQKTRPFPLALPLSCLKNCQNAYSPLLICDLITHFQPMQNWCGGESVAHAVDKPRHQPMQAVQVPLWLQLQWLRGLRRRPPAPGLCCVLTNVLWWTQKASLQTSEPGLPYLRTLNSKPSRASTGELRKGSQFEPTARGDGLLMANGVWSYM